ncbi:MAG TPA: TIGR03617 family F420-dependent LLM class oxidoreductase [Nitrososphaerales archaeon]|nr:TIGR03617 family F420-dependent LLM class oxidoreductase [Nitrososphaerales archaeon]
MKVDAEIAVASPAEAPGLAKKAEDIGFDCLWVNETKHDPFVQLALACTTTTKIKLGTSIALAFTRSPTTIAYTSWGMQSASKGRFILGLGSQVKGHIERRFGMKWEPPAPKMKETVLVLKAVWQNWQEGTPLDFRGRFFQLDLMSPFFSPGPVEHPGIPIYVAGVNPGMCRVAGMVADGLHVHPLHTVRYLREVVRPALDEGTSKGKREKGSVTVAASVFAAVGKNEREIRKAKEEMRQYISFYASTRTYRRVMELHGWGDVSDRLHGLSVRGDWERMGEEVPDGMMNEFVVEGTWEEIGGILSRRYGSLVDRVRLYRSFDGAQGWRELVHGFTA